MALPTGQFDLGHMPRFGLPPFADRLPATAPDRLRLSAGSVTLEDILPELQALPRHRQTSDFHCVTGWSCLGVTWGGWRFQDVLEALGPRLGGVAETATHVIFAGADKYAAVMAMEDLRAFDILLADQLDDAPLSAANGMGLRLVTPQHYGYKSVKHLASIRLIDDIAEFRSPRLRFLSHPRGRIAQEERGEGVPGWMLRYVYRPFIGRNMRLFARALETRGRA